MSEREVSSIFDAVPDLADMIARNVLNRYRVFGMQLEDIAAVLKLEPDLGEGQSDEQTLLFSSFVNYLIHVLLLDKALTPEILEAWGKELGQIFNDSEAIFTPAAEAIVRMYALQVIKPEIKRGKAKYPMPIPLLTGDVEPLGEELMMLAVMRRVFDIQNGAMTALNQQIESLGSKRMFKATFIAQMFNGLFTQRFFELLQEKLQANQAKGSTYARFTLGFMRQQDRFCVQFERINRDELRTVIWREEHRRPVVEYSPVSLLIDEQGTMIISAETDDESGEMGVAVLEKLLDDLQLTNPESVIRAGSLVMSTRELTGAVGAARAAKDVSELVMILNQRFTNGVFIDVSYSGVDHDRGLAQKNNY